MKNLMILVVLLVSVPAISAQYKDYKYKDISVKQASPIGGISQEKSFEKKSSKSVTEERVAPQEQEERLKDRNLDDSKVQ